MSRWKTIVKFEIIRKTSRFKDKRVQILLFVYSLAFIWALDLGPTILNSLIVENARELIGTNQRFILQLFEYSIMTLFLLAMIYPVYNVYRSTEIGQKSMLVATPVRPGEILVGEFIAKQFFYFLIFLMIGPVITSVLMVIKPLNIFEYFLIYINLFGLLALSLLIGTFVASAIENKVVRNEISLNMGKFTLLLFIIFSMAFFYFLRFFFQIFLINPQLKGYLIFLAPFWYSNNIIYIIYPSFATVNPFTMFLNTSLSIIVPFAIFFIGYKFANHRFLPSIQIERRLKTIKKEKYYHKIIKKITHKKWRNLVSIQFKNFFRKKENLAKLTFIILLQIIMGASISSAFNDPDPTWHFNIPNYQMFVVMLLSWMGGILFGILMGINVFITSKEILFVYKRSRRGVKTLIFSYLYMMSYIIIIFGFSFTIFYVFLFELELFYGLILLLTMLSYSWIIFLQAVGIQCIKPLFKEHGKNAYLISYSMIGIQILSLFACLFILIPQLPISMNNADGLNSILFWHLIFTSIISVLIFCFGIRHLKNIE